MKFNNWLELNESSLLGLYTSAVNAFPNTRKRQNSVNEISITNLSFVPFLGVRTLFVKGLARNELKGTEYNPMILFKNVRYYDSKNPHLAELSTSNGSKYFFERLNTNQDVVLRCGCQDFYWRFNYEDHIDRSLYGRKKRKYEAKINPGSANPRKLPGMCKHLMQLVRSLDNNGILED